MNWFYKVFFVAGFLISAFLVGCGSEQSADQLALNKTSGTNQTNQIAEVAKSFGVNVHTRAPELSRDHVYKQVAIRSAARHIVDNQVFCQWKLSDEHKKQLFSIKDLFK